MDILSIKKDNINLDAILNGIEFFSVLNEAKKNELKKSIELIQLNGQEVLLKQGDTPDYLYLVYSGRLAAYLENGLWQDNIVGFIHHGEMIGEMSLIDDLPRSVSIRALRQSVLLKISNVVLKKLMMETPEMILRMTRLISERLKLLMTKPYSQRINKHKIQIIAVMAAGSGNNTAVFLKQVMPILQQCEKVCEFSQDSIPRGLEGTQDSHLGSNVSRARRLAKLENEYSLIIMYCGHELSEWSLFCLHNADCFLAIAEEDTDKELNNIETYIQENSTQFVAVNKMLVCWHQDPNKIIKHTSDWLKKRFVSRLHHVCFEKPQTTRRLVRVLTNRCIGLVLSGGGVFGLAHIGVIKALHEAGIEIDAVAGVSSGAIIAALLAQEMDDKTIVERILQVLRNTRKKRFFMWQLPLASLIKPARMHKIIFDLLQDVCIEDLWVHFFCVACNLGTTKDAVFLKGSLVEAVLASNSLPGMLPPMLINGELYVDGGVTNTMPGDIMKESFGGVTIAVNVSQKRNIEIDTTHLHFPSTREIMRARLNPFKPYTKVPFIPEIIARSFIIGNKRKLNEVNAIVDYLIEPDFRTITRVNYGKMDELIEIGYRAAKEQIAQWEMEPTFEANLHLKL